MSDNEIKVAYWHSAELKPPRRMYVLARMPSGYRGIRYRYTEAVYDYDKKAWLNCGGNRVTEGGEDVAEWRYFLNNE